MKNTSLIGLLALAFSIAIAGYMVGNMQKTGKAYDRRVQVKGLSEREVAADLAVWPMTINLVGTNLQQLKTSIEQQNKAVYAFFIKQGFSKDELLQGSVNIEDLQANPYDQNQYRSFRYIAKSDFTIRTQNIATLQKALYESLELVAQGIIISSKNTWRPIEYSFSGLNQLKPEMIEEATKNAREVAEKFAQDSNSKVGKIRSAQQGQFSIMDLDMNTPERKRVRVVSTIEYQLED